MVQMFMRDLKKVSALWSVCFRVSALKRFCYKRFLKNSSGTKCFVCLKKVSALEDVRFREVPLYSHFNYKPRFNDVSSRNNLPRKTAGAYVINLDDKKVKEHIGIHYLLTEIQLYILILLNLNIFLKKY